MPWIAFLANGLWVMVIGLMGPSVPFIIKEFGIDYSKAGLIFTMLAAGSLGGTFIGGWVSDYKYRKPFWIVFLALLSAGLIAFGLVPLFPALLATVFIMSLFGSPVGAVGQSIMLQMYPEKRTSYLSIQTMFAAGGNFIAPLLISLVYLLGFVWRSAFFVTAGLVLALLTATLFSKLPPPEKHGHSSLSVFKLFSDKRVMISGLLIFLSVGVDIGFSYWLAEYFVSWVGAAAELSGFAVGTYLIGVILGRLLNSRKPDSLDEKLVIALGIVIAAVTLILFLNIAAVPVKLVLVFIYGIGIGPVFPSLMSSGTMMYPRRSGAITAVLFSMMSLGGMVFPVLIGAAGTAWGIEKAYYSLFFIMTLIAAGLLVKKKFDREAAL